MSNLSVSFAKSKITPKELNEYSTKVKRFKLKSNI